MRGPVRTQQVHLNMTPEEQKLIHRAAKKLSLPTGAWARMIILAEARTILTSDPAPQQKCG